MKQIIVISILAISIFSSCKKDDPAPAVCNLSTNNLMGTYKLTSIMYKADTATPETELFSYFDDCQKDDIYTFSTDSVYTISEGLTTCSPTNAFTGNWYLNGTNLFLDGTPGTVTDFSCAGFKIYTIMDTTIGETFTIKMTRQ